MNNILKANYSSEFCILHASMLVEKQLVNFEQSTPSYPGLHSHVLSDKQVPCALQSF
jgi:hypothetical protein